MTLTELKTLIQNYVENEETTFVSTLNDFIVNAEDRLFELSCRPHILQFHKINFLALL